MSIESVLTESKCKFQGIHDLLHSERKMCGGDEDKRPVKVKVSASPFLLYLRELSSKLVILARI